MTVDDWIVVAEIPPKTRRPKIISYIITIFKVGRSVGKKQE